MSISFETPHHKCGFHTSPHTCRTPQMSLDPGVVSCSSGLGCGSFFCCSALSSSTSSSRDPVSVPRMMGLCTTGEGSLSQTLGPPQQVSDGQRHDPNGCGTKETNPDGCRMKEDSCSHPEQLSEGPSSASCVWKTERAKPRGNISVYVCARGHTHCHNISTHLNPIRPQIPP